MEKLTIEHLAPYLPYQLQTNVGKLRALSNISVWVEGKNDWDNGWKISSIKPILRPLSDLTKEIDIDFPEEKFIPFEVLNRLITPHNKFSEIGLYGQAEKLTLRYNSMQKLFEWHFDVFGLIEKGLAIDINTLKQ